MQEQQKYHLISLQFSIDEIFKNDIEFAKTEIIYALFPSPVATRKFVFHGGKSLDTLGGRLTRGGGVIRESDELFKNNDPRPFVGIRLKRSPQRMKRAEVFSSDREIVVSKMPVYDHFERLNHRLQLAGFKVTWIFRSIYRALNRTGVFEVSVCARHRNRLFRTGPIIPG